MILYSSLSGKPAICDFGNHRGSAKPQCSAAANGKAARWHDDDLVLAHVLLELGRSY